MNAETTIHPTVTVFPGAVALAVAELKERLQHDYERAYPGLEEIIRLVVAEEEAHAWNLSPFPHLFLPDLVEAHLAKLGLEPTKAQREESSARATFWEPSLAAVAC